jgi:hypothetical protein
VLRLSRIGDRGVDRLGEPLVATGGIVGVIVHQRTGNAVGDHFRYEPTSEATIVIAQAVASRLTIPSSSYTD